MKSHRRFLLMLTLWVSIFCSSLVQPVSAQNYYDGLTDDFKIRRIDLYDSMYIIYAQRGDSIFKLYSRQEIERPQGGEILQVGHTYRLCLYPLFMTGALRSSLIIYRRFRGRAIPPPYMYHLSDYCVRNVFFACNIFDKCVYPKCPDSNIASRYSNYPDIKEPKKRLPRDINKIRKGNAANPKR